VIYFNSVPYDLCYEKCKGFWKEKYKDEWDEPAEPETSRRGTVSASDEDQAADLCSQMSHY